MSSTNIYPSTKVMPYVYRLDNPLTGEFYIGFRSANKTPSSSDLGQVYFTSSKIVKPRFKEFQTTVLAEFFDKDGAFEYEQELIKQNKLNKNIINKRYFEKGTAKMFGLSGEMNGMYGKTHSPEVKEAQRLRMIGKNKGKTYEQLYGEDKALQLKQKRAEVMKHLPTHRENNGRALIIEATSPSGEKFIIKGAIDLFCKEHNFRQFNG